MTKCFKFASISSGGVSKSQHGDGVSPEKRKLSSDSCEDASSPVKKKFSMGLTAKPESKKITMNLGIQKIAPAAPIKMSLGVQKPKDATSVTVVQKTATVAAAFNTDDESDEEEMPPEAKMRMRNIGRDTPTAAGPNSFGKNRLGFCDRQKIIERELKAELEKAAVEEK